MKSSDKVNFILLVSYLAKKKKNKKTYTNVKLIYIFPFSLEKQERKIEQTPKCFSFDRVKLES